MSILLAFLMSGAGFSLHWQPGIGAQYREPADQSFERPIYAFNTNEGRCDLLMREWTEFEDWQKPGFKPRWFKLVAWTSCQNLIFRDVDESEYRNDRIIPDSDATFKDVEPGTKLVSISGGDSEVILFFDRRGHQREIWVKD